VLNLIQEKHQFNQSNTRKNSNSIDLKQKQQFNQLNARKTAIQST